MQSAYVRQRPEVGMVFKLEMGGVHVSCSSPVWTERLIQRGARLVETRDSDEPDDAPAAQDDSLTDD